MSQSKRYKRASNWNNIKHKPENVDCKAVDSDICLKINQMWFLLQTGGGENNIVAFRQPGKNMSVRKIICSMFDFVYRLATEYGIEYITIKGKPGKYNFVSRMFPDVVLLKTNKDGSIYHNDLGEEIRYACIKDKETQHKLDILRRLGSAKTE